MRFEGLRAVVVVLMAAACTEQDPPALKKDASGAGAGAWREVKTPVPMGKKLNCDTAFGPSEKWTEALGREVESRDNTPRDADAAAVCRILVPGGAPAPIPGSPPPRPEPAGAKPAPAAVKPKPKGPTKPDPTGLLPGEELCSITAYCWWNTTVGDIKKKCEGNGEEISTEIGDLTCTRKISAGETAFRYDITILDTDSRCKLLIHAGPNLRDLPVVKACAKAAADLISPTSLATTVTP